MRFRNIFAMAGLAVVVAAPAASAADKLTYYCSAQEDWCQLMANGFQDATGIEVKMTRKSSGETFAQVKAESSNPKGDVWWGGTGDPHLQAAEEGLTESYMSPMRDQLNDWAISQAESADNKTIGIYSGALGYGYNTELLAANNLPEPKCWEDLLKPEFKGHVQMANPNSSGTAYTTLATMVQLFGEEGGFGEEDGAELGEEDGADEGAVLGKEDGAELGEEEGADEGAVLGEEEGAELGEEEGALEEFERAARDAPGLGESFWRLSTLYARRDRTEDAERCRAIHAQLNRTHVRAVCRPSTPAAVQRPSGDTIGAS